MATPGQELSSLDFEHLIGGPLVAVVNAQAQAAVATVNFIKEVGFKTLNDPGTTGDQAVGEPTTVKFTYKKMVPKSDGTGDEEKTAELTIPFLSMLPIPYLRVAETDIDFNAKINSVQSKQVMNSSQFSASIDGKLKIFFASANFKANIVTRKSTTTTTSTTRDYSMNIHVKAVQEEIPGGLDRLLTILDGLIKERVLAA